MSYPVRIRLRLAIPALLLVLAILGSLSFASFNLRQEMGYARRRAASGLEHQIFSLGNALSDLLSRGELELAERRFTDATLDPQVRTLVLLDEGGRVRFSTRRQWIGAGSQAVEEFRPEEAKRALDEHHWILHPATETRLVAYFPLNLKLTQGTIRGAKVGLLFMDYDLSLLLAQVRHEQMVSAALTMGFWVLVAVFLFLLLDMLVTRKVDRLLATVRRAEQGDLAARSGLTGQDELSRLGGAFDGLLDQIGASQNDLKESRAFLETIIETLPLMLFMKEAKELRFVRFNRAGEDLLGYPREDLIGKNDYDLFPREQADAFVARDRRVLAEGLPMVTPEEPIQTRNKGLRTLHTIKVPMLDANGVPRYLLGISEDITDGLKLRDDRQLLERQLMQTQKLEGLGSLAGGVAHDMNNVLGAILGMASIQQQAAPEGSALRRSMDIIEQACLRGRALVHGLLGFARKGLDEIRIVDLNGLVRDEVALLEHTTLRKVRLAMDLAEDLHAVHGDPSSLSHALMNLCVNAVDAMPDGGTLTLLTRNEGTEAVCLEISDTGSGMPPEVVEKALDPFFTTKPQGKGTGLGLSMVHGTVKAHGGTLTIESQPGAGTRVRIHLPAASTNPVGPGVEEPPAGVLGRSLNILVVEDEALLQESTTQILEILGHHPILAETGEAAIQLLEHGLGVDAVLLDLNMPGMGGAAALPRIRQMRPRVPIFLTTGRANEDALDLVRRFPGVALLAKPYTLKDLKDGLEKMS